MRVLVIGGTGRCGKLVINDLLARGHEVTTLARNPSAVGPPRSNLTIIKGSPTSLSDLRSAFTPLPETIIVTLAATRVTDSPFAAPTSAPDFMSNCATHLLTAMKEFSVHKIVFLQAFGVGDSWKNMHCVLQLFMKKSNLIYGYEDHGRVEKLIRDSGVNFVLVRPGRFVESKSVPGQREKEVRIWPNDGKGVPLMASVTRGSVAGFLVDVAVGKGWDGEAVVITN
ncbi:TrkA-N domain dehydrogenase [Aspergillus crustosus]